MYSLNNEDTNYEYIGVSVTIILKYDKEIVNELDFEKQKIYFKNLKDSLVSRYIDFFEEHHVITNYADSFIQLSFYEDIEIVYTHIENSQIHLDDVIEMIGISESYRSESNNLSVPEDVMDPGGGSSYNLPRIYETINVKNAMQSGLTGNGVKVGVIELNGIHDYESDTFSHKTLWEDTFYFGYDEYDPPVINQHATNVSRVIVGSDGIAPDAELYIGHFRLLNNADNYPQAIMNWLADNEVQLVNMSYGIYVDDTNSNSNIHSTLVKYNEIGYYRNMILVSGLGNIDGSSHGHRIPIPGSALNVITVGGTNTSGSEMYEYNAYQNPNGYSYITKPTIVAPTNPFGNANGTSFSAALVTGSIALHIESQKKIDSKYSGDGQLTYSLLTASANFLKYKNKSNNTFNFGYEKQYGAGLLDVGKLLSISQNSSSYPNTNVFEKEFTQSTQAVRFTFVTFTNKNTLQEKYVIEVYRKSKTFGSYHSFKYNVINSNNTLIIDLDEFINYQYKVIIRNTKAEIGGSYFMSYAYYASQYKPPKDGPIPIM